MRKYQNLRITDFEGDIVFDDFLWKYKQKFDGTYEEMQSELNRLKEDKGYEIETRTVYVDFKLDEHQNHISENWYDDITESIGYCNCYNEKIEKIILKSFNISNVKVKIYDDKFIIIILPKQYDSVILKFPSYINDEIKCEYKKVRYIVEKLYKHITKHKINKTRKPKILIGEYIADSWRVSDIYSEGYKHYLDSIPSLKDLYYYLPDEKRTFI